MDETKAIAEKMKCMDLAEELGKLLGVNPVWESDHVTYMIYSDELDDDCVGLSFDLNDGSWVIAAESYGCIRLPAEAPDLMAGMSETIEGTEDELGGKNNDSMD